MHLKPKADVISFNYPRRSKECHLMLQSQYKVNTHIVKVNIMVSRFFIFPKFLLSCITHLFCTHTSKICSTSLQPKMHVISDHYTVKLTVLFNTPWNRYLKIYKAYDVRFQPDIIFSHALKFFCKFNADTHKTN